MVDEDNEPQILANLKNDVDALKKKMAQPEAKINELILEIESLKDSLAELHHVFEKALDEAKGEGDVTQNFKNIVQKIDNVVSQNETIAQGMIAISDKLEDFMSKQTAQPITQAFVPKGPLAQFPSSTQPQAPQFTMGMPPPPGGPTRFAPRSMLDDADEERGMNSMGNLDFPPPPPGMSNGKKKSMAGLFK